LKKGSIVRLRGRITQDRWEDESGSKKSRIYVTAGHVEFRQTPSTGDKKEYQKESEESPSLAKEAIFNKQDEKKENVEKKKKEPVFTKILNNKEGVLPDELTNAGQGDVPF
jgi:single-stranded DNA-binding protein